MAAQTGAEVVVSVPCLGGPVAAPTRSCGLVPFGAVRRKAAAQVRDALPGSCAGATELRRLRTAAQFRRKAAPGDCGACMLGDSSRRVHRSACGKRMRAGICIAC